MGRRSRQKQFPQCFPPMPIWYPFECIAFHNGQQNFSHVGQRDDELFSSGENFSPKFASNLFDRLTTRSFRKRMIFTLKGDGTATWAAHANAVAANDSWGGTTMQWIQIMLEFIVDLFFGCRHTHLTRPFTMQSHSYKICLDCGHEMPYSLESMRLLHPWEIMRQEKTADQEMPSALPAMLATGKPYERWKAVA